MCVKGTFLRSFWIRLMTSLARPSSSIDSSGFTSSSTRIYSSTSSMGFNKATITQQTNNSKWFQCRPTVCRCLHVLCLCLVAVCQLFLYEYMDMEHSTANAVSRRRSRVAWSTVSNAADKSSSVSTAISPVSSASRIYARTFRTAVSVEWNAR